MVDTFESIGVAESEDGLAWRVLGENGSSAEAEDVLSLQDRSGDAVQPRRIEAVWQEGEDWYRVYLELHSSETSSEDFTAAYALAISKDSLDWASIAEVVLPEGETGQMMIVTSMLPTQDPLVATLCHWSQAGGMTCYLGNAQKPSISDD